MRVIAIREGYDNERVRRPGEEFDMPDDSKITPWSWFQRVGTPDAANAMAAEAARAVGSGVSESSIQLISRYRR